MKKIITFISIILFSIQLNAQVTIGSGLQPNEGAILDIKENEPAGNNSTARKGVGFPRVKLTSETDLFPMFEDDGNGGYKKGNITFTKADEDIKHEGLVVYNIQGDLTEGFYFWDGAKWKFFNSSLATPPEISSLICTGATLSPATYTMGQPYEGIMKIPYNGGNGGFYNGGSSFSFRGLTVTLQDGKLESGVGELVFLVEGTPEINSPEPLIIPINGTATNKIEIPFWNGECSTIVGDQITAEIKTIAVIDYMKFITDPDTGTKGFSVQCKTPDGLYTIRAFFKHSIQTDLATATNNTERITSSSNNNVQIRNNSDEEKTLMWNYTTFYGRNSRGASGGNLKAVVKKFGGAHEDAGNAWVSNAPAAYAPWGNPGIYNADDGGPEYRIYSWIDTSPTTKVAYIATIMAGFDPGADTRDITKQKVFIRIEEILAP